MFFVFHILILIIIQVTKINSFPIKREIHTTDDEDFFQSEDYPVSMDSTAHSSLFEVLLNFSVIPSTTETLKSNLFDTMLAEELFSIKQLIYDKEKPKLPSVEIKQKWPVLDLMSKSNKINKENENLDDFEVDVLGTFNINRTRDFRQKLENISSDPIKISDKTVNYVTQTAVTNITNNISNRSSSTVSMVRNDFDNTEEIKDNLLEFAFKNSIQDQQTIFKEEYNLNDMDKDRQKVIELRSLNHHSKHNKTISKSNIKACTCKTKEGNNGRNMRCTASGIYDNGNQRTTPYCTASGRNINHETVPSCLPQTSHYCTASGRNINHETVPSCLPQTSQTISCLQSSPATTCFPISTTSYYTTCYTVYPPTISLLPSLLPYQNTYQPYFYQPYQLFMEAPQEQKKYKPPKKTKYPSNKGYKEDIILDYDDYNIDNYDDFLEHNDKKEPTLKKDDKEVILQVAGCKNEKGCTRIVDNNDRNKFVDEVINDLKKIYGDSVIKNCYCAILRGTASPCQVSVTLLSTIFFLCATYVLN